MANEEHLAILKQGVDACNQWRADSLEFSPDLSGADLSKAVLVRADFQRTDLSDANLRGANLNHATLYLANLARANLSRTWLPGVDLTYANLIGTNLVQAYLARADLYLTNLRGANLSRANIREANLSRANLDGAELRGIELGFTALADIDLSVANGVESVVHGYPSSVGVDTLALTLRGAGGRFTEEQLVFFESAGVPHTLLEYLPGILEAKPLKFFRCFISYSTDDEPFAEQLNSDLNKAGIQTWKWDRDAVRGRDLHQSIDWAIRQYDKTILICSGNSLNSPQMEPEIVAALDKEKRIKANNTERRKEALAAGEPPLSVDADVLIPIRLDNTIFDWDSHLKIEVSRRMISDFTDASPDSEKYRNELQKLIDALNPKAWPPQVPSAKASV